MVLRDREPTEDGHLGLGEFPMGLHEGGLVVVTAAPDVNMEGVAVHLVLSAPQVRRGAAIQGLSISLGAPGGQVCSVVAVRYVGKGCGQAPSVGHVRQVDFHGSVCQF